MCQYNAAKITRYSVAIGVGANWYTFSSAVSPNCTSHNCTPVLRSHVADFEAPKNSYLWRQDPFRLPTPETALNLGYHPFHIIFDTFLHKVWYLFRDQQKWNKWFHNEAWRNAGSDLREPHAH